MIFPEGTRSTEGQIGFFRRGAFQLALTAKVPILPVIIDGTGEILPKHGLLFGGFHRITIKVLDPVHPGLFGTDDCDVLAAKFQGMMTSAMENIRAQKSK
jgi:1-acyl-sn-glycerol-3-phosphate acyltransferase